MTNVKKVTFFIILIIIMTTVFSCISTESFAMSLDEIMSKGKSFINKGNADAPIKEDGLKAIFIPVGRTLVTIGDAVLIVVTGIMGIQYITASPDKKAKLKQQLIGLVVAVVVIHGAVAIWSVAKNFMEAF